MNFLRFQGGIRAGDRVVTLGEVRIDTPELQADAAPTDLVLGVRPEHVTLTDDSPYRGRIEASEYLGTTQIVTLSTAHGPVKARIPSGEVARLGETVGLRLNARTLSLFDAGTGRALRTAANAGVHHG
jgi:multiple sugar transport system ATP-binding protein